MTKSQHKMELYMIGLLIASMIIILFIGKPMINYVASFGVDKSYAWGIYGMVGYFIWTFGYLLNKSVTTASGELIIFIGMILLGLVGVVFSILVLAIFRIPLFFSRNECKEK
jgi:hypothetical protein